MTVGEEVDRWIVRAKGLAPYVICLFSGVLGLGMFSTAANYSAAFPIASTVLVWLGLGFIGFGLLAIVAMAYKATS